MKKVYVLVFVLVLGVVAFGSGPQAFATEAPPIFQEMWGWGVNGGTGFEICTSGCQKGILGPGDGQFDQPYDVAVDSSDNVYVADTNNQRIQKFDSNGSFLTKWGSKGSGNGQFIYPWGLAVDSLANVYVADFQNWRIQKFDSSGAIVTFVTKWGSFGTGDGQFNRQFGVAVDSSNNVYVSEYGNDRVQKFDSNGTFLTKWGSFGTGEGEFVDPMSVAVDSSGNIYVADALNHRIQKFDSNGTFLTKWGSYGIGDGQFDQPYGVAVDSSDNVYVADTENHRIQKFDSNGNFLTKWGSHGLGEGEFEWAPRLTVDSQDNVYVVDQRNHRIQKFSPPLVPQLGCVGFDPPMAAGPVTVKKNRALPHKAHLFDADGLPVTDADIAAPPVIQVLYESGTGEAAIDVTDDALAAGEGTDGNQFVCTEDGKWQFNLKTKNYTASGTYTVTMESGDKLEYVIDPKCEASFVIK
jgi:streptogramin lyase